MNEIDVNLRGRIIEYLHGHSIQDTCTHFEYSFKELFRFMDNTVPKSRISYGSGEQYIYPVTNGFQIKKTIKGEAVLFGHFTSLEEAIKFRDKLVLNNWDMRL